MVPLLARLRRANNCQVSTCTVAASQRQPTSAVLLLPSGPARELNFPGLLLVAAPFDGTAAVVAAYDPSPLPVYVPPPAPAAVAANAAEPPVNGPAAVYEAPGDVDKGVWKLYVL